jgi:hypothetical protein
MGVVLLLSYSIFKFIWGHKFSCNGFSKCSHFNQFLQKYTHKEAQMFFVFCLKLRKAKYYRWKFLLEIYVSKVGIYMAFKWMHEPLFLTTYVSIFHPLFIFFFCKSLSLCLQVTFHSMLMVLPCMCGLAAPHHASLFVCKSVFSAF